MANEETLEDGKGDEELEKEIMEAAKKSNEDEENGLYPVSSLMRI